ncbi:hypothetical protein RE6C_04768 [Rhodopirellula europaea 6C]|uniref:Uncharacterized protein n=1 Tax=Rhodopirellula europaea 6C TaxID=1263867 RepID=M2A492_9BACT|nr:hypothetical protein RE6C_04768 [Rhodopirellula europaea 6C]
MLVLSLLKKGQDLTQNPRLLPNVPQYLQTINRIVGIKNFP